MDTDFTFDDFKEKDSTPQYINDSISDILKKELTAVEAFKQDFDDQLLLSDDPKSQFTDIAIEYIQGAGDVNQVSRCEVSYVPDNGAPVLVNFVNLFSV